MNITRPSSAGFSLVEALAVVSLTSAILIFSVPKLGALLHAGALRREATRLELELLRARTKALQLRKDIQCSLAVREYACEDSARAATQSIISANPSAITFYRSGVATPASFSMSLNGKACSGTVSLRGRILVRCGEL